MNAGPSSPRAWALSLILCLFPLLISLCWQKNNQGILIGDNAYYAHCSLEIYQRTQAQGLIKALTTESEVRAFKPTLFSFALLPWLFLTQGNLTLAVMAHSFLFQILFQLFLFFLFRRELPPLLAGLAALTVGTMAVYARHAFSLHFELAWLGSMLGVLLFLTRPRPLIFFLALSLCLQSYLTVLYLLPLLWMKRGQLGKKHLGTILAAFFIFILWSIPSLESYWNWIYRGAFTSDLNFHFSGQDSSWFFFFKAYWESIGPLYTLLIVLMLFFRRDPLSVGLFLSPLLLSVFINTRDIRFFYFPFLFLVIEGLSWVLGNKRKKIGIIGISGLALLQIIFLFSIACGKISSKYATSLPRFLSPVQLFPVLGPDPQKKFYQDVRHELKVPAKICFLRYVPPQGDLNFFSMNLLSVSQHDQHSFSYAFFLEKEKNGNFAATFAQYKKECSHFLIDQSLAQTNPESLDARLQKKARPLALINYEDALFPRAYVLVEYSAISL